MDDRRSDAELMERVRDQDDPGAFGLLVTRWRPRLARYFGALLGDSRSVDDAVQEVLIHLWTRRADYRATGRFEAYVLTVAKHHWLNLRRKQQRGRGPGPEPIAPAAELDALARLDRATLEAAVGELPAGQREVVRRVVLEGWSGSRTAAWLGLPLGTVKSRLHAARQRLRAALENPDAQRLPDPR